MRCLKCKKLSFSIICKDCQKLYLIPLISKREISNLEVISLFDYFTIKEFIQSKYNPIGYRVFKFLAKEYINMFLKEYSKNINKKLYLIGVNESYDRDYSPVSILMHYGVKNTSIKTLYNKLKTTNKVSYAGKSLEFRLKNPRNFSYIGPKNINAILIDDLITTGSTLNEAYSKLKKYNINIEFALTLANAKLA